MKNASVWVRRNLSEWVHPRIRSFILRRISLLDSRTEWWRSKDPYRDDLPYSTYESRHPVRLGIIREFWHRHWPYVAACRELGVAYELIDLSGPDWLGNIRNCACDAFLVWPSVQTSMWKQMYDERLRIVVEDLGKTIFPTYGELWLYENKRRMAYWLQANELTCARTWIFYDCRQALRFARETKLPVVSKTNMGARAAGVIVHRNRRALVRYVQRAFTRGIVHGDGEARDADWGFVILQEYVDRAKEWRAIRIGDSFFAHQKGRRGDFHSGTQLKIWAYPPKDLLEFVYRVTEEHGFRSMGLDILEDEEGVFYINELQALFGTSLPYQMEVGGRIGRLMRDRQGQWAFEEGDFCRNQCADLRVQALVDLLQDRRHHAESAVRQR